jgi:hypothetical protein
MSRLPTPGRQLLLVSLFGIAFAFVESSVVVYLRAIYYPEGFDFPLKMIRPAHLAVELAREFSTIVMMVAVGMLAGKKAWERFAYFLVVFGVWDIFYYVWLKAIVNWPLSLTDRDILFLIPLPWIGPVIAPALIAAMMIVTGAILILRMEKGKPVRPGLLSWSAACFGTIMLLYSFLSESLAVFEPTMPSAYDYLLLIAAMLLYAIAFVAACWFPSLENGARHGRD